MISPLVIVRFRIGDCDDVIARVAGVEPRHVDRLLDIAARLCGATARRGLSTAIIRPLLTAEVGDAVLATPLDVLDGAADYIATEICRALDDAP
jgi:hypothetical protein